MNYSFASFSVQGVVNPNNIGLAPSAGQGLLWPSYTGFSLGRSVKRSNRVWIFSVGAVNQAVTPNNTDFSVEARSQGVIT